MELSCQRPSGGPNFLQPVLDGQVASSMRDGPRMNFFYRGGSNSDDWRPLGRPSISHRSGWEVRSRKGGGRPVPSPRRTLTRPAGRPSSAQRGAVVADWILRWRGCPYQLVPTWDDACHELGPTSSSKQEKILEISFFLRAQLERCDSLLGPDKH